MGKTSKKRKEESTTESNVEDNDTKAPKDSDLVNDANKINKKKKKNKANSVKAFDTENDTKPKKIKFNDDGVAVEVSETNVVNKSGKGKKKKNKDSQSALDIEESEVKDEDIDQFCDDVDEEDNKQYESWITLLEEKLASETKSKNKKKVK